MKNLSICLLSVFMSLNVAFGQNITFSSDPVKFSDQVQKTLAGANKKDAKLFMESFRPVWTSGKVSDRQKSEIPRIANSLVQKKLRVYPELRNFFQTALDFVQSDQSAESFNAWVAMFDQVLKGRNKKKCTNLIETSKNLLSENVIFKSSSTVWKSSTSKFEFKFNKAPEVHFSQLDLKCYAKRDSAILYGTSGVFLPLSNMWNGNGGTVNWERAGLPAAETYAEINEYKISMKSAAVKCDSVLFHTPYFEKPILGALSERVLSKRSENTVTYPQFESYDKRLQIKDIYPGVDYDGGFTIRGRHLIGAGTPERLAKMIYYHNKRPFLVASAQVFTINPTDTRADQARIVLFLKTDSVTHPGLKLNYVHEGEGANSVGKVTLISESRGSGRAPYFNSYHNLDMYFEALYWTVGDHEVRFGSLFGSTDRSTVFESENYYDAGRYDKLTGGGKNPLIQLKQYTKKHKTRELSLGQFASSIGRLSDQVIPLAVKMNNMGFIQYDIDKKTLKVLGRTFDYIEARKGKQDYDNLAINSNIDKNYLSMRRARINEGAEMSNGIPDDKLNNASINLLSMELKVIGVKSVTISRNRFVKLYPRDQELVVTKNRGLNFSGIINAGRTEYFGSQFNFEYDNFKLNLMECDSMRIRPRRQESTKEGEPFPKRCLSKIEGVRGTIEIDDPKNKSGLDTSFHAFPILKCSKETYVFYDDPRILRGAYPRSTFKFVLEPFEMDSLNGFSNSGIGFKGEFFSAGIFPDMKETLRLQPDYSLGFQRSTPTGGTGIYGDRARFEKNLSLSHRGLKGDGNIEFITSSATSNDVTFLPDSTFALAQEYVNKARSGDPEYPDVTGKDVKVRYVPARKVLYATSVDSTLNFFGTEANLTGTLALRPDGMTGAGRMKFGSGDLLSDEFKYDKMVINADTGSFRLKSVDLAEMAFKTANVNARIDFANRVGEFKSNGEQSYIEFPENQYMCYMDYFKWYMDEESIELESKDITIDTDLDLKKSNFFSMRADQDSLNFKSPKAKFDTRKKRVDCRKVEYITVADARISPDSGHVVILKKAKIKPLENATILVNSVTKYHKLFNCEAKIEARNAYKASGTYEFSNVSGKKQTIQFNDILLDSTFQTYAKGKIKEDAEFKLHPNFDFKGEVELQASVKDLIFDGETRIMHNCDGLEKNWMKFTARIDPHDVYIPVEAKNVNGSSANVGVGVMLSLSDVNPYPVFLSKPTDKKDRQVLSANGFLHFNKNTEEYQIGSKEKIKEPSLPGNYVSLNTNTCDVKGNGNFTFGTSLGQVKMKSVGDLELKKKDLNIKSSVAIEFPFSKDALEEMSKKILQFPDLDGIDFQKSTFEKSVRELVGLEKADKVIADLNLYGSVKKYPSELAHTLYLADVSFKWVSDGVGTKGSYRSVGKIGLGSIKKKQIFKYVDGFVEIEKSKTTDAFTVYLRIDAKTWYFFSYKKGLMSTLSGDKDFNDIIRETKTDKTKYKGEKGEEDFQYMMSSKTKVAAFKRKMNE